MTKSMQPPSTQAADPGDGPGHREDVHGGHAGEGRTGQAGAGLHPEPALQARPRRWRWAGYAVLAAAMALGFWGYFSPGLRLNWETLVALCGF